MSAPQYAYSPAAELNRVKAQRSIAVFNGIQIAVCLYFIFLAARLAYAWLFSNYANYDDEGYLAVSLRSYFSHLPLYTSTFTQYGPFYYLFSKLVYGIAHAPVTTDSVRFTTLGHWLAASLLCGLAVYRITRGLLWGGITFYLVFFHVQPLIQEPGHPQGLIVSLTSALIFGGSFFDQKAQPALRIMAALLGCLFLIKINIGGYLCFALLLSLLVRSQSKSIRILGVLIAVCGVAAPLVVTLPYIRSWAGPLGIGMALSIASTLMVLAFGRPDYYGLNRLKDGLPAAITFLLVIVAILGIIFAEGSTFSAALAGIITRPARMPLLFFLPVTLAHSTIPVAVIGSFAAVLYVSLWLRGRNDTALRAAGSCGRVIWGALVIWYAYTQRPFQGIGLPQLAISFGTPFAWLLLVPGLRAERNAFPRTLLVTAAVFEVLLIYPVAGTQHAFSTFLFLPAAVVGLADGLSGLGKLLQPFSGKFELRMMQTKEAIEFRAVIRRTLDRDTAFSFFNSPLRRASISCLLVATLAVIGYPRISSGKGVRHQYKRLTVPTYLPGADRLRMPFDSAGLYHWLVSNADAHCDALVTEPLLGSLHLWTGLAPVTGMNVTAWMQLLSPEEQQQIVERLKSRQRPCVIYNAGYAAWWMRYKTEFSNRPLVDYIQKHFSPALSTGGFDIEMPAGSRRAAENFLLFHETRFDSHPGYALLPDTPVNAGGTTLSLWFRTRQAGALVGCQDIDNLTGNPSKTTPILYIDSGGHLRAQALASNAALADDVWHHIALVRAGANETLYLDGARQGTSEVADSSTRFCEIGDAFYPSSSKIGGSWMRFRGSIARVKLSANIVGASEVGAEYQRERSLMKKKTADGALGSEKRLTPALSATSASGIPEAFDLLTRTILYSVILFLPGFAVAAFVAYRGLRNVILGGAIVLAMTGLSGWMIFWLYFVNRRLGHAAGFSLCLLALASLVWLVLKLTPDGRSILLKLIPPTALTFSAALLVVSTGFMYGGTQDPIAAAAERFSHPLPADNYLPLLLAEDLRDGHVPKPFFIDWRSSDRPPLQTGIVLSQYPFLARPRRFGYTVVSVIAQSLWIFGFWLLLAALNISRRAITLVLLTCLLSGFVFVNTFFVWPKLLAAAYMLGFMACVVLQWRGVSKSESVVWAATGGVLLASSLLSHGVSFFAVIGLAMVAVPFLPKLPLRSLALTLAIAFAVYLPWIGYQKFVDPPGDRLLKWHLAGVQPLDSRPFSTTLIDSYSKLTLSQIISNKRTNFEVALGHETNFRQNLQRLMSDLISRGAKAKADLPAIAAEMRGGAFFYFVECLGFLMIGPVVLFAGVSRRIRSREWSVGMFFWAVTLATVIGWCIVYFGPPGWTILHQGTAVAVLLAFAGSVLAMWAISPWMAYLLSGLQIALNVLLYGILMNVNAGPEPLSRGYLRPGIVVLSLLAVAAVLYSLLRIENTWISAFDGCDLKCAEKHGAPDAAEVVR